jgi:hypothetical protein
MTRRLTEQELQDLFPYKEQERRSAMAGSYRHIVDENGAFSGHQHRLGNGGDVYEALEELYGMIWYLAGGDSEKVRTAQINYQKGLELAPQSQKS